MPSFRERLAFGYRASLGAPSQRLAVVLAGALAVAIGYFFAWPVLSDLSPKSSFAWDVSIIWAWTALLASACLSAGFALRERVLRARALPGVETWVVSMVLGVVAFVLALYVAGALGVFQPWLAMALPLGFAMLGAPTVIRALRERSSSSARLALSPAEVAAGAFGVLGLGALYLPLLSPSTIGTDAAWFHLTSAQDYAREGRIVPALADWSKNLPQLTSILQTYAFLVPGLEAPQRWVLALHIEFVLFCFTLLGVVAATDYLLGRSDSKVSWAAFFLFPSIYIYDSNLSGAADHIAAFFSLPLLVAGLRTLDRPEPRMAALAGVCGGAALLTKLQGVYLVVPITALLFARLLLSWLRKAPDRRSRAIAAGVFVSCAGVVLLPHLLMNAIFYRNPLYPFFIDVFPSTPAVTGAAQLFREHFPPFARADFLDHLKESLVLSASFPFTVISPHGVARPFIGAVFTLMLPAALVFRRRRIAISLFIAFAAIWSWAYSFPTPRNLQIVLPIMVAVSAALIALVWTSGWIGKSLVSGVVAFQLFTGVDLVVAAQHGAWADTFRLIRTGNAGSTENRYASYRRSFRDVGERLPPDATLLLHTTYSQLGIDRRTLLDWPGFQGLIDYRPYRTPRDVFEEYRRHGITHILTDAAWPAHSRQEEVLVDTFLHRHARQAGRIGKSLLWEMPAAAPPQEPVYRVLILGLPEYEDGLYRVEDLDQLDDGPRVARTPVVSVASSADIVRLLDDASAAVTAPSPSLFAENADAQARFLERFERLVSYDRYRVFAARSLDR